MFDNTAQPRAPMLVEIARAVARHFAISIAELRSESNIPGVVLPRHVAMFLCRLDGGKSYPIIAEFFSVHHATIIYAEKKIAALENMAVTFQAIRALYFVATHDDHVVYACANCGAMALQVSAQDRELKELRLELVKLRVATSL